MNICFYLFSPIAAMSINTPACLVSYFQAPRQQDWYVPHNALVSSLLPRRRSGSQSARLQLGDARAKSCLSF